MASNDKKNSMATFQFILGKVFSEIILITLLGMLIYIFLPENLKQNIAQRKYLTIIVLSAMVVVIIIKYYKLYKKVFNIVSDIDKMKKLKNPICSFKDMIIKLDYQVEKLSKKHDFFRTLSPLTIISVIFTVIAKIPNQSNASMSESIKDIFEKCLVLDFQSMSVEQAMVLLLIVLFISCTYITFTSYIKYNELNYERNMYRRQLNELENPSN